jgi:hypothetical protein
MRIVLLVLLLADTGPAVAITTLSKLGFTSTADGMLYAFGGYDPSEILKISSSILMCFEFTKKELQTKINFLFIPY